MKNENELLKTIEANYSKFSKGQKKISEFVIKHYDLAAFYTAQKLGKQTGVSESTVVRFACEIGYEGYPEFQHALQKLIQNNLTSAQRVEMTKGQLGTENPIKKIMDMDIERIKNTEENIKIDDLNAAVDAISNAKNIYIMGIRSSSALANYMYYYFNHIFGNVHLITSASTSDIFEQLFRINKDDVFIGISFPRYSQRTLTALNFVNECSAKTIAITDSYSAPIAQKSNISLLSKSDMTSFVDSLVAPMSLINTLIIACGMEKQGELSETFDKLENIWDKYEVYAKE